MAVYVKSKVRAQLKSVWILNLSQGQVMNKKRFYDEFSETEDNNSSKDFRPDDFKQMFAGNVDDCFRLGISVMRKAMKLYTKFYASDIIIASPLGLRTIIGNQGFVKNCATTFSQLWSHKYFRRLQNITRKGLFEMLFCNNYCIQNWSGQICWLVVTWEFFVVVLLFLEYQVPCI